MGFDQIVGQDRVKHILRLALRRGRVPNSLLFLGPEGVGKRMTAFTLARALNCLEGGDDPCERCPSCRAILSGLEDGEKGSPDVREILPGGEEEPPGLPPEKRNEETGKNTIKIKQVRYLKYFAYRKPLSSRRRIYVIGQAEKMTVAAANAFLKILEEPPPLTHFFLLSAFPDQILPTIASRCMILNLSLVPPAEIEKALAARGRDPGQARVLAHLSGGSLETALEADWEEINLERNETWTTLRALLRREGAAAFLETYGGLRRIESSGSEMGRFWEVAAAFLRDLLLVLVGGDRRLLMNQDYEEELRAAAASVSPEAVQDALDRVELSLAGLDKTVNPGLLASVFYSDIIDRES